MNKLLLFINSLNERERLFLIIGSYISIVIVGVFFTFFSILDKKGKLEEKIDKEYKNYYTLVKLTEKYLSIKESSTNLNTELLSNLVKKLNIQNYSFKTLEENRIEVIFQNIKPYNFTEFLKALKNNNLKVEGVFFRVEKDKILDGKIVVSK